MAPSLIERDTSQKTFACPSIQLPAMWGHGICANRDWRSITNIEQIKVNHLGARAMLHCDHRQIWVFESIFSRFVVPKSGFTMIEFSFQICKEFGMESSNFHSDSLWIEFLCVFRIKDFSQMKYAGRAAHLVFGKMGDFFSIDPMTIKYSKEMLIWVSSKLALHIHSVLIWFVWCVGIVPPLCHECKIQSYIARLYILRWTEIKTVPILLLCQGALIWEMCRQAIEVVRLLGSIPENSRRCAISG